jgi:NAD(P)-dependent dehydrogenase (short-subunit alcohol dehydrogenase family)
MSQKGKIALITGANKGIGLETARQLGAMGVRVIIGARDASRGEAAVASLKSAGIDATALTLDVTNNDSIAAAAKTVQDKFGQLDILVNNAGTMFYGKDGLASTTSDQTLRETFDINFFGLAAVTRAFLPLIKASPSGRIVNVTSILGSVAEHADPNSTIYQAKFAAYDSSKAAVNMFTNHLAHELKGTKVKVNAAHPGWVKTDLGGPDATLEVPDGAKTSVWLATLDDNGPSGGYYHMMVHMRW